MKVIGYIRVSTDQQNCANQRFEIETYCQRQNWKVDEFVEETISSRKELKKRKLNKLLDRLDEDTILINFPVLSLTISFYFKSLIGTILLVCADPDICYYFHKQTP